MKYDDDRAITRMKQIDAPLTRIECFLQGVVESWDICLPCILEAVLSGGFGCDENSHKCTTSMARDLADKKIRKEIHVHRYHASNLSSRSIEILSRPDHPSLCTVRSRTSQRKTLQTPQNMATPRSPQLPFPAPQQFLLFAKEKVGPRPAISSSTSSSVASISQSSRMKWCAQSSSSRMPSSLLFPP